MTYMEPPPAADGGAVDPVAGVLVVVPATVVVADVKEVVVAGVVLVGAEDSACGTDVVVVGSVSSPVFKNQKVRTPPKTTKTTAKRPQLTRRRLPPFELVT
jgi:hypothetical protein